MSSSIKIDSANNYIRKNVTGKLSDNDLKRIIKEISLAASLNPDHNILIDLRKTTASDVTMTDILKSAIELEKFESILRNRIAAIIPSDSQWQSIARKAESAFHFKKIQFRFFTDPEEAIEWFSNVT